MVIYVTIIHFPENMITHTLYGGLGNQLFQIFTTMAVSLKFGHECYFEWHPDSILASYPLLGRLMLECKPPDECRALEAHLPVIRVDEPSREYHPDVFDVLKDTLNHQGLWVLNGYFQSYRYFEQEYPVILQRLGIRDQQLQLDKILQQLTTDVVITMHFRIGDYKHLQHTHPILPRNYYRNALQVIVGKQNPSMQSYRVVYVCQADDQETVEDYYIRPLAAEFPQNIQWTPIAVAVEGRMTDDQQLLYMSLSTHHIMANSTFSWWSAYLRPERATIEKEGMICYPKLWFNQDNDYSWAVHFHEDTNPPRIMYFHPCQWRTSNPPLRVDDMFPADWTPIDCPIDEIPPIINSSMDVVSTHIPKNLPTDVRVQRNMGNLNSIEEEEEEITQSDSSMNMIQSQCLCYRNPKKHASMTQRFDAVGMPLSIYEGVSYTDSRIVNHHARNNPLAIQRLWSVTYGHLDMIQRFLDSKQPYGIFCEDDILVNRTLPRHLPNIVEDCDAMDLDILLLGYMKTCKVEGWMAGHTEILVEKKRPYTYHEYPDDQWGVHMYMLSRKGAQRIIDTYAYPSGYADKYIHDASRPFSPDWTISKCPGLRRALISPMFAVEDGADPYEHYGHDGQWRFHMDTFRANYIPEVFI